jgi:hypothetical protein
MLAESEPLHPQPVFGIPPRLKQERNATIGPGSSAVVHSATHAEDSTTPESTRDAAQADPEGAGSATRDAVAHALRTLALATRRRRQAETLERLARLLLEDSMAAERRQGHGAHGPEVQPSAD